MLVTDGSPNCSSGSAASFATTTQNLLALGIKTIAIGFDYNSQSLNNVAANGGMAAPYDIPILVSDSTTLQNAFNDIAGSVVTCIYDIVITNEVDYDSVNFFFIDSVGTETPVPYDEDCSSGFGWHWVDETTHEQIEFCPDACELLQGGDVEEIKGELNLSVGADAVRASEELLERSGALERMDRGQNLAAVRLSGNLPTLVDLLPRQAKNDAD